MELRAAVAALPRSITADLAITDLNGNIIHDMHHGPVREGHEALSLDKMGIVHAAGILANRREVYWDQPYQLEEQHRRRGRGVLQHLPEGYPLILDNLIAHMLMHSDNTAMVATVDQLGGADRVNTVLEEDSPLSNRIPGVRLVPYDEEGLFACINSIKPEEAAVLLAELLKDRVFSDYLSHGDFANGLRREIESGSGLRPADRVTQATLTLLRRGHIPLTEAGYRRLLLTGARRTAHPNKEGTDAQAGIFHDVARIGPHIVSLLTSGWDKTADRHHHPAHELQGHIGKLVHKAQRT